MAKGKATRHEQIHKSLMSLDLCHHSLRHVGHRLASEAGDSCAPSSSPLYERSLRLARDCSAIIHDLCDYLDGEDLDSCQSLIHRVDRAVQRSSDVDMDTLRMVSVWRVIEGTEQFLKTVGEKYGYALLSEQMTAKSVGVPETRAAELIGLTKGYKEAAATKAETLKPLALPSFPAVPRWRATQFLRPGLMFGIIIVLAFAVVAIVAPLIAPPEGEDPYIMPREGYLTDPQPPNADHPLGTMESQYDVFYGLVWGTRVAFRIGLTATVGRALIGVLVGLIAGYYGGLLDALIMRVTDAFLAFPIVPATLLMLVFFAPTYFGRLARGGGVSSVLLLSLILFGWMQYARLVRGNVLAERAKQYVEAAIAVGARSPRIIFRHVLPNVPQGLFVLVASDIGAMVVLASVFTFLGLSGQSGLADWGWMLKVSRNWIVGTPSNAFKYWYTYIPPSMAIVFFSIGWNLIGDGLRDFFDPRMR